MAANDFTGLCDKGQLRVPLGQLPCTVEALDEVCVPNVLIEMSDAIVEPNNLAQRNRALDGSRRTRNVMTVHDETIEPAFARILDDTQRALGLVSIFNNDVLEFLPQEVLDHGLIIAFDFDQVGEYSEWLPTLPADVVKKLLNRLGAVRALHREFADRLQAMANALLC